MTARFTRMLGSTDAADAAIAQIRKRADFTLYWFVVLASGGASLLPIMKRTGSPMDELLNTVMVMAALDPAQRLEGAAYAVRS